MGKFANTDPEDLREPILPKGNYNATIVYSKNEPASVKGVDYDEALKLGFVLGENEEVETAAGTSLFTFAMPVAKGASNDFLNICKNFKIHPSEFDTDEMMGRNVVLSVGAYKPNKGPNAGEPRNVVNKVRPADDEIE